MFNIMCYVTCMSTSLSLRSCCRWGTPFQGLRVDSCLTLGNELSEETHVLPKQETLLGQGAWTETRG